MNETVEFAVADIEELVQSGRPVPERGHRYQIRVDEERFTKIRSECPAACGAG